MSTRFAPIALGLLLLSAPITRAVTCSNYVIVQVPQSACKSGTATAAIPPMEGATYAWSVEGGRIVGAADGPQITIALGDAASVTVTVTAVAGCEVHSSATFPLHDPLVVNTTVSPASAGDPVIINWSYEHGTPARQTITGSDFGLVVLAPSARTYTYVPSSSGGKQVTIDASLTADVVPPPVPGATSKRRAVARPAPVTASACSSVHTTTDYVVAECSQPFIQLNAPASVVTGTNFQLSVMPQPGAVTTWTIHNGTPAAATGDSVIVTAGASGKVDFTVHLTRGACVSELAGSVAITATPVCNNPTAVVSAGTVSCGEAVIKAVFTGTPPFSGTWSDGIPFATLNNGVTRTVTEAGNYGISTFRDAACAGTVSGTANIAAVRPTATIVGKLDSCVGQDSVTVHFTGTPPFTGRWSDNTSFATSDMQLVKPVIAEGTASLMYVDDATQCRATVIGYVNAHPSPKIKAVRFCQPPDFDNVVGLEALFYETSFKAPLTANWDDGTVSTGAGTPLYRFIRPAETKTYTIVSARDAYCPAIPQGPQTVTIYSSPTPDFLLGFGNACVGQTAATSLATPPPAGVTVSWYAENATILSGQGTSSIQYQTTAVGTAIIGCIFNFADADRCPTSTRRALGVDPEPSATLSVFPTIIHAGQTAMITYSLNYGVFYSTLANSLGDTITPNGICNRNEQCTATYTSSHGAGTSSIEVQMTGWCSNQKKVSIPLTILP